MLCQMNLLLRDVILLRLYIYAYTHESVYTQDYNEMLRIFKHFDTRFQGDKKGQQVCLCRHVGIGWSRCYRSMRRMR